MKFGSSYWRCEMGSHLSGRKRTAAFKLGNQDQRLTCTAPCESECMVLGHVEISAVQASTGTRVTANSVNMGAEIVEKAEAFLRFFP